MSWPKRIAYLSDSVIPSRLANSVHVMRMSQAFAEAGVDVTLFARRGYGSEIEHFRTYGVGKKFILRYVPDFFSFWPTLWNAIYSVFTAHRMETDLLYTRSIYTLALSTLIKAPIVIEFHSKLGTHESLKSALIRQAISRGVLRGIIVISEPLRFYYVSVLGVSKKNIIMLDRKGVIHRGRKDLNQWNLF